MPTALVLGQGEKYFGELTYSGITAIMGPYATAAEAAGMQGDAPDDA